MRLVRAAAAARIIVGAESRYSLRWCSPIPYTSSPTLSAYSISSSISRRRSDGLTARLAPVYAAAKLSIPTCTNGLSVEDSDCSSLGNDAVSDIKLVVIVYQVGHLNHT